MRRGPNGALGIIAATMLCLTLSSCQGPAGSMAFIDPIMAYVSPDAVQQYSGSASDVVVLPDSGAQATLFAAIDEKKPRIVYLSPLLASEIGAILERDEKTVVVYLGDASPRTSPRLHAALFSSVDAARIAGELAAAESKKRSDVSSRVAAIFVRDGARGGDTDEAVAAFKAALGASGDFNDAYIETVAESYSQATADRLKGLDIGIVYLSAPVRETERWLSSAFDESAYIMAEYALPQEKPVSSADIIIAWDISATLKLLDTSLSTDSSGPVSGLWRTIRAQPEH